MVRCKLRTFLADDSSGARVQIFRIDTCSIFSPGLPSVAAVINAHVRVRKSAGPSQVCSRRIAHADGVAPSHA